MYINRRDGDASKAIFCLAPTGLGFGVRVYHAMADGCIPLIISDNVTQPWEGDFLPYSLFAVRLPESDIPRCASISSHSFTACISEVLHYTVPRGRAILQWVKCTHRTVYDSWSPKAAGGTRPVDGCAESVCSGYPQSCSVAALPLLLRCVGGSDGST